MYKIKYLANAKKDIDDILFYISHNLKNSTAAYNLLKEFERADRLIIIFPHGTVKKVNNNNYYFHKVKNYYFIYVIDEQEKIIKVMRVLYKKRNYDNLL